MAGKEPWTVTEIVQMETKQAESGRSQSRRESDIHCEEVIGRRTERRDSSARGGEGWLTKHQRWSPGESDIYERNRISIRKQEATGRTYRRKDLDDCGETVINRISSSIKEKSYESDLNKTPEDTYLSTGQARSMICT
jgi:hypothetical protein